MRRLVERLASIKCEACHGELLFSRIENAPANDTEVAIYVCAKCGHRQSRREPTIRMPRTLCVEFLAAVNLAEDCLISPGFLEPTRMTTRDNEAQTHHLSGRNRRFS